MPDKNAMGPNNKTEIIRLIQKEADLNIKNILFIILDNKLNSLK